MKSIIFLGTGPSSGVPNLHCLSTKPCKNCLDEKNRRTCVSILIETDTNPILIDCGKDFKMQYEKYLIKKYNEKYYDFSYKNFDQNNTSYNDQNNIDNEHLRPTIILTHYHADAILGLDSLKQMVPHSKTVKMYADKLTSEYLEKHFGYLFIPDRINKKTSGAIEILEMKDGCDFEIQNIKILPFYVKHGNENCMAFRINNKIVYISDCSEIPENEFKYLIGIEILIIECTVLEGTAYGHLNFNYVVETIKKAKPKKVFLVGMSHLIDRNEFQEIIDKIDYDINIAFDGMEIFL